MTTHLEFPNYYLNAKEVKEGLKRLFLKMQNNKTRNVLEFDEGAYHSKRKIIQEAADELGLRYMEIKSLTFLNFSLEKPTLIHFSNVEKKDREIFFELLASKESQ